MKNYCIRKKLKSCINCEVIDKCLVKPLGLRFIEDEKRLK